jgi:hypothetical protein
MAPNQDLAACSGRGRCADPAQSDPSANDRIAASELGSQARHLSAALQRGARALPPGAQLAAVFRIRHAARHKDRTQRASTIPHGDRPTGTLVITLRPAVSTMVTSFDGPFAV